MSLSILLLGTSKIEHELQSEIELSNLRLINGPQKANSIALLNNQMTSNIGFGW